MGSEMCIRDRSSGVFPVFMSMQQPEEGPSRSDYIPRSATVRVTCGAAQRSAVEAKLINLGGLGVRSFRGPQF